MNHSDLQNANAFIRTKVLPLLQHPTDGRNYVKAGFPMENYLIYPIKGRTFYAPSTNIFRFLLSDVLLEAKKLFPKNFGTGNALTVLHALNKTEPVSGKMRDAIRIFQNENFCYLFESVNGQCKGDLLRVDLFRKLDRLKGTKNKYEFTGGILHLLKHFSYQGTPLSTGNEHNDLRDPWKIIDKIVEAFFFCPLAKLTNKDIYISSLPIDARYKLKFVFYRDIIADIYYINTVYKEKI